MDTKFSLEKVKERENFGGVCVDGKKLNIKNVGCENVDWLIIGPNCGPLLTLMNLRIVYMSWSFLIV